MRKSTVLFSFLLCFGHAVAGQNFMLKRPGTSSARHKQIDLRIREERRETAINCFYLSALVAGIVLPRLYPDNPKIHMGIPASIAVSTMTYAFYIDNRKPNKFRK
jgi:hypothetical protein